MTDSVRHTPISVSGASPEVCQALFVHATGFCKETLLPVVDELEAMLGQLDVMVMDQRGHGGSTPHDGPFDWNSLSVDVLTVLESAPSGIVGVGHSSGGASVARAEILAPGTFANLILVEPIIMPGPYEPKETPLSLGAARRRRSFESRDAVWDRLHRGPFTDWTDAALDMYVDNAFHETPDGWTLRCEPQTEAEFYRQAYNIDTWDRLNEIRCPVTVVAGEHSNTHVDPFLGMLMGQFAGAELVVLPGLGHLAPMESPTAVAASIRDAMERFPTIPTIS
jgi:pimeloyl-ACP methyl ester carboxylesterase